MALCKTEEMRGLVGSAQRLMGLDVGKKTIGIATCDAGWRIATAHSILRRSKFTADMDVLFTLITELGDIGGLVIGWPVNMDGSEGPRCDATRDFAHALMRKRAEMGLDDLPIAFQDERLSTEAVERAMLEGDLTRQRRHDRRDALAAAWILQGFIDGNRGD